LLIDRKFALKFAAEWIAAWNTHDLDRVLSHYTEDFEFSSPKIPKVVGEPSGKLKGKPAIRAYWEKALQRLPGLRFELIDVTFGIDSVVIYYHSYGSRRAMEVMQFDHAGKVVRSAAHYDAAV
jgi:ketosteroid isomerase-like protein